MIRLKILWVFCCCWIVNMAVAQHELTGVITSMEDSTAIGGCKVSLNDGKIWTLTDSLGHFKFSALPKGNYILHTEQAHYKPFQQHISIKGKDKHIEIKLESDILILTELVVEGHEPGTHMKGVEDMGIYEGKKSEVIMTDSLVANLATNNARQIYSRVAGLNIWENDGAGLQLSIGGRGLDPNRTSNFNVRQNGCDISADALGYPESYYTPPIEGIERIQIVRGAASLQYGTQFGGLLNFVMRKPVADKKIQLVARQSLGSFNFYNTFTSLGGTVGKVGYYTFFQYKKGDGWRPNSVFEDYNFYSNVTYKISKKTDLGLDITLMDYLAQQPGGLSDKMFDKDPRQSNRERNWFKVKWNMLALHFDHKFNEKSEFNIRFFGLSASRYSVGFRPNRVETIDDNSERDLIKGEFTNWGAEARYLRRYSIGKKYFVLLAGTRYYHGFNHSTQGFGSKGKDADFTYDSQLPLIYDYRFPNQNISVFAENIIYVNDKFSITPGIRFESINTTADGFYGRILRDLAGNIYDAQKIPEYRNKKRQFIIGGIGFSYKPVSVINLYANASQNYRSITFNDMRITNFSAAIDPDLEDEKGYSLDLGIRSEGTKRFIYDVSVFYLNYNNRIDEAPAVNQFGHAIRLRSNVGQAIIFGLESYLEADVLQLLLPKAKKWNAVLYANTAWIQSEFVRSKIVNVKGKNVPFVPELNLKSGVRIGYKKIKASFQYTYLSDQYTDATNEEFGGVSAVIGRIPSYSIVDISASYEFKMFKLEASINNVANRMYFTRRATGYPGPGILPSDGRSFYLTLQVKI